MLHYTLTDLQAFGAVADEGNLTRGAERVHLSAPTVSMRIKGLEQALGVQLLDRRPRGVALTPAGQIVRRTARKIDSELASMDRALQPFALKHSGTMRICTNFGAAVNFLSSGVGLFLKRYPQVRFVQERMSSHEVVRAVAEDRSDLGMGAFVGAYPGVEFIDLAMDQLVLAVPEGHRFALRESISFAECLDEPFLALERTSEMQNFVYERARELGRPLEPKLQLAGETLLLELAGLGIGVGIVSRRAYERLPRPGTCAVDLTEAWAVRRIRIAVPQDPAARCAWTEPLVQALLQACQRLEKQSPVESP